jgi:hypothetical protein
MPRLYCFLGPTSSTENIAAQIPVISVLTEITVYTIIHSVSIISAQSCLTVTLGRVYLSDVRSKS